MLFLHKFNNPAKNPGARTRTCTVLGHQAGGGRGRAGQSGSVFPPHSHSRPRRKHVRTYAPDPAADGGRRLPSRFLGGSDFKGRLKPFKVDYERLPGLPERQTGPGFQTDTMPPSPRRPMSIPPTAASLATPKHGRADNISTTPHKTQYKTILSVNFRKTSVSAAVPHTSLRAPTGCSPPPPSSLSVCLSRSPSHPTKKPIRGQNNNSEQKDRPTPLLPPRLNPFRVLAAPIPSASLTQRANHPETHRPSIPPSVLASASNNYNRRTPSFLYLVYGAAKHVSCTTSLIAPSLPVLLLCRL